MPFMLAILVASQAKSNLAEKTRNNHVKDFPNFNSIPASYFDNGGKIQSVVLATMLLHGLAIEYENCNLQRPQWCKVQIWWNTIQKGQDQTSKFSKERVKDHGASSTGQANDCKCARCIYLRYTFEHSFPSCGDMFRHNDTTRNQENETLVVAKLYGSTQ